MKKLLLFLFLAAPLLLSAQLGGRHVYDFLNLAPAARVAALGGVNVSTQDYDANFAWQNPALANDSMHQQVSFSIVNYLANVTYGYTSYARSFEGIGDFHAGIHYLSYGKMIEADAYGQQLGEFSAKNLAFVVGGSRQVNQFRAGVNLKLVNASVQGFRSYWAMAFDLGGSYRSPNRNFTAGMNFRNIGFNLSRYNLEDGTNAPLPFEVIVGISHKLEHMPLRFSITATNLNHPNLIYYDEDAPPQIDLSGDTIQTRKPVMDNIFRHAVFGAEFLLSKNFNLRAGYNHMRRQELRAENRGGISGFSFGAGVKINRFRLDYSLVSFHAIGPTHNFTLATNLGEFHKKN